MSMSELALHIFQLAIESGILNQVFHQQLLLFLSVLHLKEVLILVVKPENGKAKGWLSALLCMSRQRVRRRVTRWIDHVPVSSFS